MTKDRAWATYDKQREGTETMTKTETSPKTGQATMTVNYGIRCCHQCGQIFQATQDVPVTCGECGSTEWSRHGPYCNKLGGCCEVHKVFMGDD